MQGGGRGVELSFKLGIPLLICGSFANIHGNMNYDGDIGVGNKGQPEVYWLL